ncbi:MAG: 3-hydroxyacyl-CoA dehydrogenase/enoyl-CoA hydratase family protein [Chloroflexota bacterium]
MTQSIRRAAVIGSGVMGGAIAALIADAGIPVYLLDIVPNKLTPEEEKKGLTLDHPAVRNRIVNAGLDAVKKSRPAALFTPLVADLITVGNLEDNFGWVGEADWVIEVIVENLAIKRQLMARIDAVRKPGSIITSNTSGIPIAAIAAECSPDFKAHFLGTHFFNPPRYMKLLEIIPTPDTLPEVVKLMADFGERVLGKGVVFCKDRPNFIGNRLIAQGNHALRYAIDNGYTVEEIDAITGPLIGRPKTATFRLMDLVGLDIAYHVGENLYNAVPDDEARESLRPHPLFKEMVDRGWLGDKAGQGFYKKIKKEGAKESLVLDYKTMEYRPAEKVKSETISQAKKIDSLPERLRFLVNAQDRFGQFLWASTSSYLAYAANRVPEIADDIVNIDNAMKWGFSHEAGPFEVWDALGVAETAKRMEADGLIVAPWVKEMLAAGHQSFYKVEDGKKFFYDLATKGYKELPARPEFIVIADLKEKGKEIAQNPSASLIDMGDGVLLLEFHSKMNALDNDIAQMMFEAVKTVESDSNWKGIVVGNQGENFCVGANIFMVGVAAQQGEFEQLAQAVKQMQDAVMALRFCQKPVVAAPFGMTLGGGAEVAMGAARIVAAAETYMGQVEVGVGVLPGAGGCKELLRRVVSPVMRASPDADPFPFVQKVFEMVAMAKVSTSAEEARQMGFLTPSDRVIMNKDLLLWEAKKTVLQLADSGYQPPARTKCIYAIGQRGLAAFKVALFQMQDANYASEHDAKIARKIAYALCGGELTAPQWVDEQYILDLEREAFVELCREPKTLERIWHMLQTGKPLRN